MPEIAKGIYPFKDIKLSRADIEWLLATHENGRGPVDWSDEDQRQREGLDLRGAELQSIDLSDLPLARMLGGLEFELWPPSLSENNKDEGISLDVANLQAAIHLEGADLKFAHLEGAILHDAHLEEAILFDTYLKRSDLSGSHLENADLMFAHLERSILSYAHLEHADLSDAHLEGASMEGAQLGGAILRGVFFDDATRLNYIHLYSKKFGVAYLADIHWSSVNVAVLNWSDIDKLGDEYLAIRERWADGKEKSTTNLIDDYLAAVRAYRQLAVVLHNQGLNEDAARFTYRAQFMQRKVCWHQRKIGQYLFSLFLDLFAGYGYKPRRSFITYVLVISLFAAIYLLLGTHLAWNEAIVISMTAFHGRGFFPDQFHPGDPLALVAAIEALVGLLIEITLIATLTQRLFGK